MQGAVITTVGNLTADPELRYSAQGKPWVRFSIAVNEYYGGRDGGDARETTTFLNVKAFGDIAENIASSLHKGDRVMISGKIRNEKWEDSQGVEQRRDAVILDEIGPSLRWAKADVTRNPRNGNGGGNSPARTAPAAAPADDDNPFA